MKKIEPKRELAIGAGALTLLLNAFLVMALNMGWISLTDVQLDSILGFATVALGLVFLIAPVLINWFVIRNRVTLMSSPRTHSGKPAVIVALDETQNKE